MPCPYQAATPTMVVYWSGIGCGHGMPCPYIATGYSVNAVSVSGGNADRGGVVLFEALIGGCAPSRWG